MEKKKLDKVKEKVKYCQDCKFHANHPSRCHLRHIFVPRKSFCEYFRSTK